MFCFYFVPQALFFENIMRKQVDGQNSATFLKIQLNIYQKYQNRPHQQNGALRAPFLLAFFVIFGKSLAECSIKLLNFVRQPYKPYFSRKKSACGGHSRAKTCQNTHFQHFIQNISENYVIFILRKQGAHPIFAKYFAQKCARHFSLASASSCLAPDKLS